MRGLLLVVYAIAIAGCGGDKGNALTGAFIDSAVQGLRYATPTQHGFTGAEGEFTYLAGETVTFSLGGIVLGEAKGASMLTPYDLVGIMPVTDEVTLRNAFFPNYDTNVPSDLDRVANLALFLITLDSDGIPDNGIDLTGWDATLTGASLSFTRRFDAFARDTLPPFAQAHGVVLRFGYRSEPMAHLNASVGAVTPMHLKTRYATDNGNDGSEDHVYTYAYDGRGLVTGYTQDQNADGLPEYRQTATYGVRGESLSTISEGDGNADGVFEDRVVTTFTNDARGVLVAQVDESFTNDVLNNRYVHTTTRDSSTVTVLEDQDQNGDGVIDGHTRLVATYDATGHRVSNLTERDYDGNGVVDYRLVTNDTFDSRGRNVTSTVIYDNDGDSDGNTTPDRTSAATFTWDDAGLLLSVSSEERNPANVVTSRDVLTMTYDGSGRQLTSEEKVDTNADGINDVRRFSSSTYDASGRVTLEVNDTDADYNGVVDTRVTYGYTYDAAGNRLTTLNETDNGADGTVEVRHRVTSSYDAFGDELDTLYEHDANGDGTYETADRDINEYSSVADGLMGMFAQHYGS